MTTPIPPRIEDNIQRAAVLRDQMEEYLAVTERNTDAVNNWLSENKNTIIMFHHRLVRALNKKDDAQATELLTEMGNDIAGFVLSLEDFSAKAKKGGAFIKAAAAIKPGLPDSLQEPLPEIDLSDVGILARIEAIEQRVKKTEEAAKNAGISISGMFNRKEKHQRENDVKAQRQLTVLKDEILGLQSNRHYYIDGVMDWAAEALATGTEDENGNAVTADDKMLQYQNPAYIIQLATDDYERAIGINSLAVRQAAVQYSELASAIDRQDVNGITEQIATAYPDGEATDYSEMFRQILLEDYNSLSLPEIILTHIDSRDDQAELLMRVRGRGGVVAFADAQSPESILEKFVQLTLDKDPLDPKVLHMLITTLMQHKMAPEDIAFPSSSPENIFQRIAARFESDLPAQQISLAAVLSGLSGKSPGIALTHYMSLFDKMHQIDDRDLLHTLGEIEQQKTAPAVTALWNLCYPGALILDGLCRVTSDPVAKAALLEQGMKAGLLEEIRAEGVQMLTGWNKFIALMEKEILCHEEKIPVDTIRSLIAHSIPAEELPALRKCLTKLPDGWLVKIADSTMAANEKLERISALLEPFGSDIVKANVLNEAAESTAFPKAKEILFSLEKNLVGENIRLSDDRILCHLPRLANIWYNPESRMLRYTVQGQSHTLLENVKPEQAQEILSLVQRRGPFLAESGGLFNPDNVDAIHYTPQGPTMSWHHVTGSLNADAETVAELQTRTGFLHVTGETGKPVSSFNLTSLCFVQPMEDGTILIIDKYGSATRTSGTAVMPKNAPLLDLGGAYFNPGNASIIRLAADKKSFEFRIEGDDFEKLLDPEQHFLSIPLSTAAKSTALQRALTASADIHAPVKNLHLNMKALGYLAYNEKESGFYCKKHAVTHKPGFINVEPEMAQTILSHIGAKPGIAHVGDLVAHQDSIDDAYYNSAKQKLQFVIGPEVQEVSAPPVEGWATLLRLSKDKNFAVVTTEKDYALKDMPVDVIHRERATLFVLGQERMNIITDHLPFHVNLSRPEALAFFTSLEEEGLASSRKATTAAIWKKNVSAVLNSLPQPAARAAVAETVVPPSALLQQVLASTGVEAVPGLKKNAPKKLSEEFTPRKKPAPKKPRDSGKPSTY